MVYSAQKRKLSAPEQGQNFTPMLVIQFFSYLCFTIGVPNTNIGVKFWSCSGAESLFL